MSFRLGGTDGVSVAAAAWGRALTDLGLEVTTVAGAGPVDHLVPGLAWPVVAPPPTRRELEAALTGVDVVVVENVCSLPLNPEATAVVVDVLRGRPALLHHHDLPWQRAPVAGYTEGWPAHDPAWRHVTTSKLGADQLAGRGIDACVIPPAFDVDQPVGDRSAARLDFGLGDEEVIVLHPVRAIARKAIPDAIALAEALGARYWLTGPPEEGYEAELRRLLAAARCPVLHRGVPPGAMASAYAAADAVAFPSRWEGFGHPLVESAIFRRPLVMRRYPVAREVAALGFRWFDLDDPGALVRFLADPDPALLDHNAALARRHFSLARVAAAMRPLLDDLLARPRR